MHPRRMPTPRGALLAGIVFALPLLAACGAPAGARTETTFVELVETAPVETTLGRDDLRDTHDVWAECFAGARRTIDLAHFYASDEPGSRLGPLVEALEAAAARGVRVRFLAETKFVATYPDTLARLASRAGIEVRHFDGAKVLGGGILHAKSFLVDGEEAFVGSQNFDWRSLEHIVELGVRVRAPGVAAALAAVFERDWAAAGGEAVPPGAHDATPRFESVAMPGGETEVALVASPRDALPEGVTWDLPEIVARIEAARERLFAQCLTYRASERDGSRFDAIDGALRRAAARGVDVRLLVADWSQRRGTIEGLQELQRVPGIEVRIVTIPPWSGGFLPFARVAHAKCLVADGARAWIGTSNLEASYFFGSRNVGLLLEGAAAGARVERFFLDLWESPYAKPVDPDATYEAPRVSALAGHIVRERAAQSSARSETRERGAMRRRSSRRSSALRSRTSRSGSMRDLRVEELGGDVGPGRPAESVQLPLEPELPKHQGVLQGLEHLAPQLGAEVDVALGSVGEPNVNRVLLDVFRRDELRDHGNHSRGEMARSGLRSRARFQSSRRSA